MLPSYLQYLHQHQHYHTRQRRSTSLASHPLSPTPSPLVAETVWGGTALEAVGGDESVVGVGARRCKSSYNTSNTIFKKISLFYLIVY